MRVKIDGPDGKVYRVDVPEGSTPEATVEQFTADMWPNIKRDAGLEGALNTARIVGAGAGRALAGAGELGRVVTGGPPKEGLGAKLYSEFWRGEPPTSATEAVGRFIPTDPSAVAKERGIPLTPMRDALARAADFATGTALLGGGAKIAALAGVGGAIGQRVAGDEGALAMGLALPIVGARAMAPKVAKAPTLDEVKAARKAAYAAADSGGAVVSQGSLGRMLQNMHVKMAPKYFAKDTHPRAFQAFRELTEEAQKGHVELGRLFKMRGRMGALQGSAGIAAQDADMIRTMRGVLDDHIANMQPVRDVIAGDMRAVRSFKEGVNLFRREKGLKAIESMIENARTSAPTYTAAGFDTALRNQFKAFVKNRPDGRPSPNKRFFTPAEWKALEKIARGGPVANTLRQLSRFAPQNILHTLLLQNLHPATGALTGAGAGARFAASGATKRNIKMARDLIARGYPVPATLRRYLDPSFGGVFLGQGSQTK